MQKTIMIAGGTGFIGSHLINVLLSDNYKIKLLSRNMQSAKEKFKNPNVEIIKWSSNDNEGNNNLSEHINSTDHIINLSGANVGEKRWDEKFKKELYDSRINSTRKLVNAIANSDKKPEAFVCASGVGIYGHRDDNKLTESSSLGNTFLAKLCKDWESEANKAEQSGVRVVNIRTGMVLDKTEGALPKMLLPFKFFAGGQIASGKQYMSWIHIKDAVNLYKFCFENNSVSGPVNLTTPNPVTNAQFCKSLAKALHSPCWATVPAFAVKIAVGEFGEEVINGQRVIPQKALDHHFKFEFTDVNSALKDLLV